MVSEHVRTVFGMDCRDNSPCGKCYICVCSGATWITLGELALHVDTLGQVILSIVARLSSRLKSEVKNVLRNFMSGTLNNVLYMHGQYLRYTLYLERPLM